MDPEKEKHAQQAMQSDADAAPADMTIEEAHEAMPEAHQPTIGFIIPFPEYIGAHAGGEDRKKAEDASSKIPPFIIYTPPPARLQKPAEGQKESLVDKAQRKWQEEEDGARGKTNLKSKAVHVRALQT